MHQRQRFRIAFPISVYIVVALVLILPGIGVFREIYEEGYSVIGFPHIMAFLMYAFYLFWIVRALGMHVQVLGDTITVKTFWKTREYSFGNDIDIYVVEMPVGRNGMNVTTNYIPRLRIADNEKQSTIDLLAIKNNEKLRSVIEEKMGTSLRQERLEASTLLRVLDFFV